MITNEDVGKLVQYYREGWYHGYIEHVTRKGYIKIRPIGAKGSNPHPIVVQQNDIKEEFTEEAQSGDIHRKAKRKMR